MFWLRGSYKSEEQNLTALYQLREHTNLNMLEFALVVDTFVFFLSDIESVEGVQCTLPPLLLQYCIFTAQ